MATARSIVRGRWLCLELWFQVLAFAYEQQTTAVFKENENERIGGWVDSR